MNPLKLARFPKIFTIFLTVVLAVTALAPERLVQANSVLPLAPREAAAQSQGGANLAAVDMSKKNYLPFLTRPGLNVTRFETLPPGSRLPSEADCAASVKATAENKRMNTSYNTKKGTQKLAADYFGYGDPKMNTVIAPRVSGNFTGTTDEILQWAACKWGIDEDVVRAQAVRESWWQMTAKGDWTTDANACAPGHGLGADGTPGQCPESWGILQARYIYRKSGWPSFANSTAFNADLAYAEWRACYEGYEWWLTTTKGDQWGCVGRWFAGAWHTPAAETYISDVKDIVNTRTWEQDNFQEP
jgi:hypothetical protein